eukprot:jgi/Botrbrau1/21735/Bobra.43_1s0129.1
MNNDGHSSSIIAFALGQVLWLLWQVAEREMAGPAPIGQATCSEEADDSQLGKQRAEAVSTAHPNCYKGGWEFACGWG